MPAQTIKLRGVPKKVNLENAQIAIFVDILSTATGIPPQDLIRLGAERPVNIIPVKHSFECASDSGWCWGAFANDPTHGPVIGYVERECIGDSALSHELGHYFMWLMGWEGSGDHSNETMWGTYGIVANAQWRAWKELCSEHEAQEGN